MGKSTNGYSDLYSCICTKEKKIDPVILARIQFGLTIGFHFIYAPLSIGLAWFVVWMIRAYQRTGNKIYDDMSRLWIKVLGLTFVIGVASGIVMEFQFGTNWGEYSKFVGDVFGAPLAIESIGAFFLESTFLALLVYGRNKISPKFYLVSAIMVAFGATLSAFWILVANSWQQTPAGYHIVNGRAQLTSITDAIANPSILPRFLHTFDACLMTGAFFVIGICSWYILMKPNEEHARIVIKPALMIAFIASVVQLGFGHYHAFQVAHTQPAKLAAIEGIFKTQQNAPLLLFGIPDSETGTVKYRVGVPGLLSFLVNWDTASEVTGLDKYPPYDWPPILFTFYPFHIMVVIGLFLILVSFIGIFLVRMHRLTDSRLFLTLAVLAIPLPFIANELGWMTAECGRQPWVVYNVLRTSDAISVSVPASQILFSIIMFGLIYLTLFGLWIYSLLRIFKSDFSEQS